MNEAIIKSVKSLPPLPETVAKVQQACADPMSGVAQLTKIIERDPMLTANLLKAANSPLYGFAREIKTLAQAVSLFGFATVRGFAVASAIKNAIAPDLRPYGIDAERFVSLCQTQNALTIRWYGIFDRSKLEILSPASFLFSIGRLVMANEIVRLDKADEFKKIADKNGLEAAEREILDAHYLDVSAEIFNHWRFETALIEAIRSSREPLSADASNATYARALKVVQIAVDFAGGMSARSLDEAVKAAEGFDLPFQALENVSKSFSSRVQ
jgi:HD-like signal output (HDOD) protein